MEGGQGGASCLPAAPGTSAVRKDKAEAPIRSIVHLYGLYNPSVYIHGAGAERTKTKTHIKSNEIIL